MKDRTLGIVIGVLNLILLIVCGVSFLGKDKTAPVISIGDCNFVYEEELPDGLLFQGVTAYDKEEGDLTEQIVIEKIVTDKEKKTASITYGVVDSVGNVGKATRTITMPVPEKIDLPTAGEAGEFVSEEVVAADVDTEETTDNVEEATETEDTGIEEVEAMEETAEGITEETTEEAENTENEGEGTTTGGNVTVVGSNRRN